MGPIVELSKRIARIKVHFNLDFLSGYAKEKLPIVKLWPFLRKSLLCVHPLCLDAADEDDCCADADDEGDHSLHFL